MKTLIALPCMNKVDTDFMKCMLDLRKSNETYYAIYTSSMIYDSRNNFAANAIVKKFDRVLFIDSDMTFEPDLLERLSADMDKGLHFVSAMAFKRSWPVTPVIYERLVYERQEDGKLNVEAVPFKEYPQDAVFEIAAAGFGCVMVSVDLLTRVLAKYGPPFDPMTQMGEDMAFCHRVHLLGEKMYCDSAVKVGHIGQMIFNEQLYIAQMERPDFIPANMK